MAPPRFFHRGFYEDVDAASTLGNHAHLEGVTSLGVDGGGGAPRCARLERA